MTTPTNHPGGRQLANHEIVTLALYLLGGDSTAIDLEDIAMKANDIAPGRFTWRKFPTQINIKNVDAFLWDAKKPKNGSFVLNVRRDEWILTEEGLNFAAAQAKGLKDQALLPKPRTTKENLWLRRERERMLTTDAFHKVSKGQGESVTPQEAEGFFRLDAYVLGKQREEKLLRVKNLFRDDPEIAPVIATIETKLPKR